MVKSLAGCALLFVAACGGSTEPKNSAAGTYVLTSINGHALPVLTSSIAYTAAGSIVLRSDGYFTVEHDFLPATPTFPVIDPWKIGGTWTIDGAMLTLADTSLHPQGFTATIAGRTITSSDGHFYEKR